MDCGNQLRYESIDDTLTRVKTKMIIDESISLSYISSQIPMLQRRFRTSGKLKHEILLMLWITSQLYHPETTNS
jgi:hypothetical protein